jgi:hypothetical protein
MMNKLSRKVAKNAKYCINGSTDFTDFHELFLLFHDKDIKTLFVNPCQPIGRSAYRRDNPWTISFLSLRVDNALYAPVRQCPPDGR